MDPKDGPRAEALELRRGEQTSARIILILRVVRECRFGGALAERVYGPWMDPVSARETLDEVHHARLINGDVRLPWLGVAGRDVVAVFLDERGPGARHGASGW
jgi:hypothetical protein